MFGTPVRVSHRALLENPPVFVTFNEALVQLYPFNPSLADEASIQQRKIHPAFNENCKKTEFLTFAQVAENAKNSFTFSLERSQKQDSDSYKTISSDTVVKLFRFVITAETGLICGCNDPYEWYSHEQLARGTPVIAAGEFGINQYGRIAYINNKTGHYRVPFEVVDEVVLPYLRKVNIKLLATEIFLENISTGQEKLVRRQIDPGVESSSKKRGLLEFFEGDDYSTTSGSCSDTDGSLGLAVRQGKARAVENPASNSGLDGFSRTARLF